MLRPCLFQIFVDQYPSKYAAAQAVAKAALGGTKVSMPDLPDHFEFYSVYRSVPCQVHLPPRDEVRIREAASQAHLNISEYLRTFIGDKDSAQR